MNKNSDITTTLQTADLGHWALDNSPGLAEDGWCLIAPFGEWPKTRVYREGGRVREQKFVQVLDDVAAEALLAKEHSLFGRLKRAFIGVPVFKGHGDLAEVDPQAIAGGGDKIKLGVVDQIRKGARGLEAHFALDAEGAAAVGAGWKFPSSFWYVRPMGSAAGSRQQEATGAIRCRPFKLISVALTPFPNIAGVESLANAETGTAGGEEETPNSNRQAPEKRQAASAHEEANGDHNTATVESAATLRRTEVRAPQEPAAEAMPPAGNGGQVDPVPARPDLANDKTELIHNHPQTDMKLITGWLLAQGGALANTENPNETEVLAALQAWHTTATTQLTALGNERQSLSGRLTTLETERDGFRQQAEAAATALAKETLGRQSERQGRAEAITDLAIQRGKTTVALRDAQITSLANSPDFELAAQTLLNGATVVKIAGQEVQSGKQNAGLANEQQLLQSEYNLAFQTELMATGQNPARAHNNIMTLPKYAGLAAKLLPKQF